MKALRSVFFWLHLAAGTTAGIVILIMSATGAALALKPQILRALDSEVRTVAPASGPARPLSELVAAVRSARPDANPTAITIERDPSVAVAVVSGQTTTYVDPFTGRVLGDGSSRAQRTFRTIEDWHRWLAMEGEGRTLGRSLTGVSNIAFLFLALSGLYLWWPRKWTLQHTSPILWFRRTATGRARDFNWHNVIGFWCAPAFIVMTATAVVMSYPWANDLLFRVAGSEPPSVTRARSGAPPAEGPRARTSQSSAPVVSDAALDGALHAVEEQMPAWRTISLRMPPRARAALALTLTDGSRWNAFARSQLSLDAETGAVLQFQSYDQNSAGQKARTWFRFGHTGELFGLPGQIVAGVACAGGVVLVWTGIALALSRLRAWLRRSSRARSVADQRVAESG